jgi:hypothetical protein
VDGADTEYIEDFGVETFWKTPALKTENVDYIKAGLRE